jgi:hypothetical protein
VLSILGVAGLIALVVFTWNSIPSGAGGANGCVPADFPRFPHQHLRGYSTFTGTGGSSCKLTFDDDAEAAAVTDYYAAELDTGDWVLTRSDSANGVLTYRRRSNPKVHGTVAISGHGQRSLVQVEVITDR